MGLFDGLLSQVAGNVDVANLAEKLGIDVGQAEGAIGALADAHGQPGDTIATAAGATGLSPDILQQIVGHIGGEGSLGRFAEMLGGDNAGGVLGDLASGLFGKS